MNNGQAGGKYYKASKAKEIMAVLSEQGSPTVTHCSLSSSSFMSLSLNVAAEEIARKHLISGDSIEEVHGIAVPNLDFYCCFMAKFWPWSFNPVICLFGFPYY